MYEKDLKGRKNKNIIGLAQFSPGCELVYNNILYHHHPFKATFQRGTIPKCKIHLAGPLLNVKLVAERPPGVVFVGWGF